MTTDKEVWDDVRKIYNYPNLREPIYAEDVLGGAHFDFSNEDIRIGENILTKATNGTGLSRAECLRGIQIHEVGHYSVFPRNLSTIILSGKIIDDFFSDKRDKRGNEIGNFIFQTFADMNTDVASVLDSNKRDSILKLRTNLQSTVTDELNNNVREVMLAYLHKQAGEKYEIKEELKEYHERMLQIEFLDPKNNRPPKDVQKMRLSLYQFGDLIYDMIEKYGRAGQGIDSLFGNPSDLDIKEILGRASNGQIRDALRKISEDISRGEYSQVKEWLKEKGVDLPEESKDNNRYIGIGTNKGELKIDEEVIVYYRELSKKYPLVVNKKPIPTEEVKKSYEQTEKWRVGKEPLLAMPHLSGGLLLPGITRQIKVNEKPKKTMDYDIPHLLVVMDSSGSMPNPKDRKSHAVLGGVCAARSYYVNDSAIGVINFSGDSFYLPYTRDLDQALGAITAYQGGGTRVDVDMLKKMLSPEEFKIYEINPEAHIGRVPDRAIKKEVQLSMPSFKKALESGSIDLLMFTDGGIGNLEEVMEFFEDTATLNRGTIVLTHRYAQETGIQGKKVRVHPIDKEEDIPGIVLGDVRRNFDRD